MPATTIIIISVSVAILFLVIAIVTKVISIKNKKSKNKLVSENQELKDKLFFKNYKIIKYQDWKNHDSGIIISSGKKSFKSINNKFVIRNLENKYKKTKKIDYKKLAICKSEKKSSLCIAPPGSGKTQALLLPTLFYMINCKEKPNLIVTDPKPEIYEKLNNELIKNNYKVINLSTIEILNTNNNYITDYWNPLEDLIFLHKRLLLENNLFMEQEISSKIMSYINRISSYFKLDDKPDYWKDNAISILKFMIALIMLKIEQNEMNYNHLNLLNIKSNLDKLSVFDLLNEVKKIRNKLNDKSIKYKSLNIINKYLMWSNERQENISSFVTNTLGFIDALGETYLGMLTSKTTFNLEEIINSNKSFVIFLTINTASNAHINEKILLKIWLSIINEKIDYFKRKNEDFKNKSLWWLLDETGNLPKLDFLKSIIAFGRGRNEFALPIFQSDSQMQGIYGNELIESCENKILFSIDNDKLGQKISNISGNYEQIDQDTHKIIKNKNIELENVINIPSGYLGIWTYKRNSKSKNFYLSPITYWYMLNGTSISAKTKLKFNSKYLLSDFISLIEIKTPEEETKEHKKKKSKYDWLGISDEIISIDKIRCNQLINHIVNHLNYFKYNKNLITEKIIDIQNNFNELKIITNNDLNESLIQKFLNQAKNNKNIIFGNQNEQKQQNK